MAATIDDRATRFRGLVLPLLAYLNRLAFALTGSRQSAEDLVQESVLRGLRYFDTYRGDDFRAWMAAIMRNLNRDRPRRAPIPIMTPNRRRWRATTPHACAPWSRAFPNHCATSW